jgi:MFS family permease
VELFAVPRFTIANLIVFSVGFALYGSLLLVPLYLQSVLHLSATPSGLVLLPAGLVMVALSPLGGHLSDVLAPRLVVPIGMIVYSVSIAMMATIGPVTSFLEIIVAVCIGRMALACLLPSLYSSALRSVPSGALSQASGILNFSRQLGGTIGVAAVAVLLRGRVVANWQAFANDIDRATLHSGFGRSTAFSELVASRDGWIWAQTFGYREVLLATSAGVLLVAVGGLLMGNKASLKRRAENAREQEVSSQCHT